MASTFSGIEIGKRSLNAHQSALSTTGHNLSNASVEGYSRQRVKMRSVDAIYRPQLNREEVPGQIGQGVSIASVERIRDELLENRIVSQGDIAGYWKSRDSYMLQLERVSHEPYDTSVRKLMDRFWTGWQELSVYPEGSPERQAIVRRGEALIDGVNRKYHRLKDLQKMVNEDLFISVGEVNAYLAEISSINEEIVKSEALGDNPNDLYDRRDLLVNRISEYLPVRVDNRDPDEFLLHTRGLHLIQGKVVSLLGTEPNAGNEGYYDLVWERDGQELNVESGKLGSLLEMRDVDVRGSIQELDEMSLTFADLVNDIHRQAWSANGITGVDFFAEYPFVDNLSGNYDRDEDGVLDSTYVYRITGINRLESNAPVGFAGTITLDASDSGRIDVSYNAVDTVSDIINRINSSGAELTARLNREGYLEIRAGTAGNNENPDFVIRHVEDSGQFLAGYAGLLAGSGPENAYDWGQVDSLLVLEPGGVTYSVSPSRHPSAWLRVSREVLADPSIVASGLGEGGRQVAVGDNRAAVQIAQLRHSPVMAGWSKTFDDWFALSVGELGLKGEIAGQTRESQDLVMKELEDLRQSVSGVNLDEEFSEMIKFQHGYNAAARFINTIDQMLETIINRLGV